MRLITRAGNDFSSRFPFIAMAVSELPVRSCLIDGEAIVCNDNGLAVFELIRRHGVGEHAVLSAFDLLELDEEDLRRKAIETRKALLAKLLKRSHLSLVLNEHYEEDGAITKMSRGDVRRPSCSPKMRRGGSRRISPSCRSWYVRLRGARPAMPVAF
jgi:ATP-dependent DNA ligase